MNLPHPATKRGFTLIELSIVLVIIGLIIGGVLVGQDLIKSAAIRATIAQIEKYNSAVNTFKNKYGGIPGDLALTSATQFGFVTTGCNGTQGMRDGNGLLDGWWTVYQVGETGLFWQDLSTANMIDGTFPNSGGQTIPCTAGQGPILSTSPGILFIGSNFPQAKLGAGNFIYVYEYSSINYFGLSAISTIDANGNILGNATLPVNSAYNIDLKMDDGLPITGSVVALYVQSPGSLSGIPQRPPNTATSGGNATSCYDTTTNTYSTSQNNGSGPNCALSFKMQGAAR